MLAVTNNALSSSLLNHPLNITRGKFGFQNSLSVHNITWLGQGKFTYEKHSYFKRTTIMIYSGKKTIAFHRRVR
jgi:hypothetical protein